MSDMSDTILSLVILIAAFVVGAVVLYFVVRAAVIAGLRHHALWRADGSYDVELQRHQRAAE